MTSRERDKLFQSGLRAYRHRELRQASDAFCKLVDDGSTDPRHLSYCGLLLAIVRAHVREGLELCERALEVAWYDPEMYLNLARLHFYTGWQSRATEVLRMGLRIDPGDRRLLSEIQRVSIRNKPALGFLDRGHALNRVLGRLRSRFLSNS